MPVHDAAKAGDHLSSLNTAQHEAAGFEGGTGSQARALLVIAGAGTGKTSTLAHRVAHLLVNGTPAERILLLTFSRRAAREMTRRAVDIASAAVAGSLQLDWAGTFHSVANRLLRQYAGNVGLDPGFTVLDREDAADLLDVIRHDQGLARARRRFPRKHTCLDIYSRTVNGRLSLKAVTDAFFPWCTEHEPELRALFREYVARKNADRVLDYDDLLLYWHAMVQDEAIAAHIGQRFDHVLVDEYQDTNRLQAEILMALKPSGEGLMVVGDDAQSIYSFRSASIGNILSFPEQFGRPGKVVTLETNYRSVQPILDAANALMRQSRKGYRKALKTARPGGGKPMWVTVEDEQAQAEYVLQQVLEARESGVLLRDQAVLFRSGHHSDRLEVALTRANIPYVKYGGLRFLEAAHVKDLLALLRWSENLHDRIAMFRTVQLLDGFGPRGAAAAWEHLSGSGFRAGVLGSFKASARCRTGWRELATLVDQLGSPAVAWPASMELAARWYLPQMQRIYETATVRAGDIEQLVQIAGQYPNRERFLTELALDPPAAAGDLAGSPLMDEDYLILSTVHSAKGQEWSSVFLLNVADGNFPSEFATGDAELIEEERRLLYVAMTRARNDLHLLEPLRYFIPQQTRLGDGHVYGARSRFVTPELMGFFEQQCWPPGGTGQDRRQQVPASRLDIGSTLEKMW